MIAEWVEAIGTWAGVLTIIIGIKQLKEEKREFNYNKQIEDLKLIREYKKDIGDTFVKKENQLIVELESSQINWSESIFNNNKIEKDSQFYTREVNNIINKLADEIIHFKCEFNKYYPNVFNADEINTQLKNQQKTIEKYKLLIKKVRENDYRFNLTYKTREPEYHDFFMECQQFSNNLLESMIKIGN